MKNKPKKSAAQPVNEVREVEEILKELLSHGFGKIEISVSYGEVKEIKVTREPLPDFVPLQFLELASGITLHFV